jgi:asparaginyl-tRNA synthetase
MKRIWIDELHKHVGEGVEIRGWLYNKRSSGKIHFLLIRDGTGIVQGVMVKNEVPDEIFDLYDNLELETSLIARGSVREDPRAPGGFELGLNEIQIVSPGNNYPITKKSHGVSFLMPLRHLWLRSRKQWALLRIRDELESAIEDFFRGEGFVRVDAPILTPSAAEGTTTLFKIDYFGEPAYLTQSGQLYVEAACMALGKVYCFGPTFRAEKSKTRRHLTEFWMVEPEIAWATLDDIMDLSERFVSYLVERVLERRGEELKTLERDTSKLENISPPFPRITYDEAVKILKSKGMSFDWGEDFGGDEETIISESFDKPVMVHRYPAKIKAFYMKRDPVREELALCVDVLAPEGYGEIIGGSEREDDLKTLERRIEEFGYRKEDYEWYLDLRRYGSVPHAGFGLGLERTIAWIAGIHHVRETIPFPRLLERMYP